MPTLALSASRAARSRGGTDGRTDWLAVWLLFLSGCTLALHSGKAPSALLRVREEFGLSLTAVGALVSCYALLIAAGGALFGLAVARAGYVRFAIAGVALAGLGSLAGSLATGYPMLLATRALEGAGWVVATCALPALIARVAAARDRSLAMGLWSSFVPVGSGSMLLLAPWLEASGGWRASWLVAGTASLVAATTVALVCRGRAARFDGLGAGSHGAIAVSAELRRPLLWAVVATFFFYSLQFLAAVSFLPTLLVERGIASAPTAARLTALVILANAAGNIVAGLLLRRGIGVGRLMGAAAALTGVAGAATFLGVVPDAWRVPAAIAFSAIGGAVPGTLFAVVPSVAGAPAAAGLVIGAMLQGAGLGQLLGPLALPASVEIAGGWSAAGWFLLAAGACAALTGAACGGLLSRARPASSPARAPRAGRTGRPA